MLVNIMGTVAACRRELHKIGWDTSFPRVSSDGDHLVFPVHRRRMYDGLKVHNAFGETILIPIPRSTPAGTARAEALVKAIQVRECFR